MQPWFWENSGTPDLQAWERKKHVFPFVTDRSATFFAFSQLSAADSWSGWLEEDPAEEELENGISF